MVRKTLLALFWFPLTLSLLITNLALLAATTHTTGLGAAPPAGAMTPKITATGSTAQILGASVVAGDARALLLQNFLDRNKSPMSPYSEFIVKEADSNGLDFRMIVAIAMCESNLGKRMPSRDSFNPFGIAVFTGQNSGKKFDNWEHAISWVSSYIKKAYYDKGITDLKAIGAIWAPPSVANGYSWTNCVQSFQESIL